MKKQLLLFGFLSLFIINISMAQVRESSNSMTQGVQNSFVIDLTDTNEKIVEKTWKNYSKKFKAKPKKIKKSDEWMMDDAIIPGVSGTNTVDVYYTVVESGGAVTFTSWYDLGGAYLNSEQHADQAREAEKMLMSFAIEVAKEMVLIELKEEEKELKQLDQALSKLGKEKSNYEKAIEQAKEKIQQAEADIEQNLKDQENAKDMITSQKEVIEEVKRKLADLKG